MAVRFPPRSTAPIDAMPAPGRSGPGRANASDAAVPSGIARAADLAAIVCAWALLFLPAAALRTLHYEEGRRALAALDMLTHGHWMVPEVLGLPYVNKPPLLPWLIAAVGWVSGGVDEWAVRLPPLLVTLAGALLVHAAAWRHGGRVAGLVGAAAFLLTPMILEKAAVGETDTTVTVAAFAAVLVWWDGARTGRVAAWRWLLAGLLLALAALAKGPVPLAYAAVGIGLFALCRRRWHDLPGLAAALVLALVPVGLWAMTAYEPGRADHWQGEMRLGAALPPLWAYLEDRIDLVGELAALLMPWLALAVPVFVPARRRRQAGGFTALLLAWPNALPRYAMPAVPAVAAAAGLAAAALWERRRVRRLVVAAVAVMAAGQVAVATGLVPLKAELYRYARPAGAALAAAMADDPAPVYLASPTIGDHNIMYYIGRPVTDVPPAAAGDLPAPAWILTTPQYLADVRAALTRLPAEPVLTVHGRRDQPYLLFRLERR